MYNPSNPMQGVFLPALYYHWNKDKNEWDGEVKFYYRTYDDTQYSVYMAQRQPGAPTSKPSLSIETNEAHLFPEDEKDMINDVVHILKRGTTKMKITKVEFIENTSNSIIGLFSPQNKAADTLRIHLNKEG